MGLKFGGALPQIAAFAAAGVRLGLGSGGAVLGQDVWAT